MASVALVRGVGELIEPEIPEPIIGGKGWACEATGRYLLQRGPGVLRCIACTHTGSAYLRLWDAVEFAHQDPKKMTAMFHLAPTVLGHWAIDYGFNRGLICEVIGVMAPFITIVWLAYKPKL